MVRYGSMTINEYYRLPLHRELREKLGLKEKSEVSLQPIGNIVILQKSNTEIFTKQYFFGSVDEIGKIELPYELMRTVGWRKKDSISVYSVDDYMLILKLNMDD